MPVHLISIMIIAWSIVCHLC